MAGAGSQDVEPRRPASVGKYRVDGIVGRGAMGIVYKGYDTRIDRFVAIKTLRPDVIASLTEHTELLKRFSNEARWAGRCQHPNIVTVFDFVEQDGAPFIIMEYVEAGTLDNVVRSGATMPLRQVCEIMVQLLLALEHAHGKGVIHRDVKPANILCPAAASIKVTDFGVARVDMLSQTSTGIVGTPNYMSPEQLLGRPIDSRTDLYAAGTVLFLLLTGVLPFRATAIAELIGKVVNEQPPSLASIRPGQWGNLDTVVQRALARHPEQRFQTASEFIEALNTAIGTALVAADAVPLDLTMAATFVTPGTTAGGTLGRTMAERLKPATLATLEQSLARRIGPIARMLVGRMARETRDAQRLMQALSDSIADQSDAESFRKEIEQALRRDDSVDGVQAAFAISESEQQEAVAALLPLIGPIARAVAKKEAARSYGVDDYYGRLASFIPSEADRTRFLAQRGAKRGDAKT